MYGLQNYSNFLWPCLGVSLIRLTWIGTNAVNTHVLTFLFVVEPVGVAFTSAVPEAATFLLRLVVVPLDRVVTARSSLIFLITEVHISKL